MSYSTSSISHDDLAATWHSFSKLPLPEEERQWRWKVSKTGRLFVHVPHWFVATIAVVLTAVPWLPWSKRFSLRTLVIATTLVGVVLGLAVYAARN